MELKEFNYATTITEEMIQNILTAAEHATIAAWDGCHKIYLGLDDDQAQRFEELEYEYLEYPETMISDDTYRILATWFNSSCALRFIQAVASVEEGEDPNKGYTSLIPQGVEGDLPEM